MNFEYIVNTDRALMSMKKRGAFLTVRDNKGRVNVMTIGWGSIGYIWGKPIFTLLVRESRYTHELLEKADDFVVCIPLDDKMRKELGICGSKSGRDYDKFKECNLAMKESKRVKSPAIEKCQMIYECKIVYKHNMDLNLLDDEINRKWYDSNDPHTIYYGEIVNCYKNE